MAFVDFDTKKMSYEKWLCNHKNGRQTFSNFLRKKERAFIANELAEGTSYIKIWKFLKKKTKCLLLIGLLLFGVKKNLETKKERKILLFLIIMFFLIRKLLKMEKELMEMAFF